jgi:L-lactate dehydrogenase
MPVSIGSDDGDQDIFNCRELHFSYDFGGFVIRKAMGSKIAVVGAGAVGTTFAYSLLIRGLVSEIVLIDKDKERAEGEAMDLSHGLPFLGPVDVRAGDYLDCEGSDIVVVTAGAPRRSGQSRLELAEENFSLMKEVIPKISEHNKEGILLMVTNPLDVMTYAALKLSGFSKTRVIGSGTILDTARLRVLLGEYLGVDSRNIHSYIIGEHGDSEVPLWSLANVAGIRLKDYCPLCRVPYDRSVFDQLFAKVRDAGKEIIKRKGRTNYSIGLSLTRIVESIVRDENSILTVSCYLEGYHGVTDACLSVPVVVNREGIKQMIDLPLDEKEDEAFRKSAETVKEINKSLGL